MAACRLQLLGPFSLLGDGGVPAPCFGRKSRALVTCIAAHGDRGVQRTGLTALLWPDHDEHDGRSALRQCLHQVRRATGARGFIGAAEDSLFLRECEVDLWRFESLAAAAEIGDLLQAAALYRGPLAQGLCAVPEFDSWLAQERDRVRGMAEHVLDGIVAHARAPDDCEAGVALARILLAEDSLHEGCWRASMLLHERLGLRAKALQVWEECRRVLRAELGVEPCRQTRAVYEQVRAC